MWRFSGMESLSYDSDDERRSPPRLPIEQILLCLTPSFMSPRFIGDALERKCSRCGNDYSPRHSAILKWLRCNRTHVLPVHTICYQDWLTHIVEDKLAKFETQAMHINTPCLYEGCDGMVIECWTQLSTVSPRSKYQAELRLNKELNRVVRYSLNRKFFQEAIDMGLAERGAEKGAVTVINSTGFDDFSRRFENAHRDFLRPVPLDAPSPPASPRFIIHGFSPRTELCNIPRWTTPTA